MTDKKKDKIQNMDVDLLSASDEQLLQAFFADNRMAEIPDDGFSARVMQALPAMETEQSLLEFHIALAKRHRLEHLWTAVCVALGVIAAVLCQGWEQIQGWLYGMKIDFLLTGSHALRHGVETAVNTQNLWLMLAGIVVLVLVWGYNELADARE